MPEFRLNPKVMPIPRGWILDNSREQMDALAEIYGELGRRIGFERLAMLDYDALLKLVDAEAHKKGEPVEAEPPLPVSVDVIPEVDAPW